jgi:hypothetical protein
VTHARRVLLFQQFCRLARSTAIRQETVSRNILPTIRVQATRHRNRAKCLDTDSLQLPIDTPRPIPSALVISVVPRPLLFEYAHLGHDLYRHPLAPLLETGGHARKAPTGSKEHLENKRTNGGYDVSVGFQTIQKTVNYSRQFRVHQEMPVRSTQDKVGRGDLAQNAIVMKPTAAISILTRFVFRIDPTGFRHSTSARKERRIFSEKLPDAMTR